LGSGPDEFAPGFSIVIDYDRLASDYARHRRVHPEVLRRLFKAAEVHAASRVLEVGCGTGNYLVAIQEDTGCFCWGIDPSERMLAEARRRSTVITWQTGKAESLGVVAGELDLVFSVDVIHHIGERLRCFQEAWRVLRPGGRICTVTDSEWIIRHRVPLATYFPETVACDLGRYPKAGELRAMMEQVSFARITEEIVEFSYPLSDIQLYRAKAFSCLQLIAEEAFQQGLRRLECDLRASPIPAVSRYQMLWGMKPQTTG
jgi:ubiquinone/menaquinone biosynthesis C-methylase UbiE